MQQRRLGRDGPLVSALGLGCMGMSDFYGDRDDRESMATLHAALEKNVTLIDTADMYGPHTNEELVGRAIAGKRDQAFLATKFGIVRDPSDPHARGINGRPDYVRQSVEGSLRRLGVDTIDLYYQHRVDPQVPIEDTVGAMADLVREGKVRYLGLSEAAPETLRRAQAVHPISALQSEYSLWTRDPEDGVLGTCRELGISFVAYSPLGRGFLTGAIRSPGDFEEGDFRRHNPRFQGENFQRNLDLVDQVHALAEQKQVLPSQLALAWVLARGEDVIALFGTKRRRYLRENLAALEVRLSDDELAQLDAIFPRHGAAGERYGEEGMRTVGN
ncbi:aldo/keto reductase [Alcanivorax xiamenensis]|uniref:Aldo/keto reductase n=1 Tax=Alcanivorax xiamenensis TaxID=1177156 RepID=A0ABQ6YCD2_9GAMM|nr:aldo/keto reductase [Alcanivorax xiamenensis]KAF0807775.1 aldo/keto reductase [Alcanivorax xiamenensis]